MKTIKGEREREREREERERKKREREDIRHTTNTAQNDIEKRKTIRERWRWRIDL